MLITKGNKPGPIDSTVPSLYFSELTKKNRATAKNNSPEMKSFFINFNRGSPLVVAEQ